MNCAASLDGRGEAHVQLLYALGSDSTLPVGGAASYDVDPVRSNSGRPPLNCPV